jgi:hypothetical protein
VFRVAFSNVAIQKAEKISLYSCDFHQYTRVYPKVSGLAAWSKNCKWYISLPLDAVVSLLESQSSEVCLHYPLKVTATSNTKRKSIYL